MLKRQLTVLWIGIAIVLLMLLFPPVKVEAFRPPWTTNNSESIPAVSTEHRFRFLLSDTSVFVDETGAAAVGREIDWQQLRLQWLTTLLWTFALLAVFRDRRGRNGGEGGDGFIAASDAPDPQMEREEVLECRP